MKTIITILFYVFGILATLYGVNTAMDAKHTAEAKKPDVKLSLPVTVVKDVQQATKVQNHDDQIKKLDERVAVLERAKADAVVPPSDPTPPVEQPVPVVEKPNEIKIDKDDPKEEAPVQKLEVLEFSLPNDQCPACVVLEREVLNTKEFQDYGFNVTKGSNPRRFGIKWYPTIVVYNPEKKTSNYSKFQAAGMSTSQVVNGIKNAINTVK